MKKGLLYSLLGVLLLSIVFSGCLEEKKENNDEQSEIEDYAKIYMATPGNLTLIENVSNFDMMITNPLNATVLVHNCFNLEKYSQENQTFGFIGRFKDIGGQFFIDLDSLTDTIEGCGDINLTSNEILTYNFAIQNAEEGIYRISMAMAIMNVDSFVQSFGISNEFYLTK